MIYLIFGLDFLKFSGPLCPSKWSYYDNFYQHRDCVRLQHPASHYLNWQKKILVVYNMKVRIYWGRRTICRKCMYVFCKPQKIVIGKLPSNFWHHEYPSFSMWHKNNNLTKSAVIIVFCYLLYSSDFIISCKSLVLQAR